jgi:cell shape-determining protein MreD
MIYAYHLIVALLLIVLQTTLLARGSQMLFYDLLGPFAVYLGVQRPPREAIPVLVLAGLAMDSLSGGVFGIHLTAYLWIYSGVRWAIQFLHAGNTLLTPLLVTAGVAFESLLKAFAAVVLTASFWPAEAVFSVVTRQILWGALTGPFLMLALVRGLTLIKKARTSWFAEEDQLKDS